MNLPKPQLHCLPPAVHSPPGAPEILVSGKDFATIEWLKSESNGGSEILHYLVERRERKSARWVKVNRDGAHLDTTLKVCGLTEGNIYQFRVTAINKAGESEASEVSLYAVCRLPTRKSTVKVLHFIGLNIQYDISSIVLQGVVSRVASAGQHTSYYII